MPVGREKGHRKRIFAPNRARPGWLGALLAIPEQAIPGVFSRPTGLAGGVVTAELTRA